MSPPRLAFVILAFLASTFSASPSYPARYRSEFSLNEGVTGLQTKAFYYDGVRRIAEVIARPPAVPQGANYASGGSQNNENPMALEGEDPPPQQIIAPPPPPIPVPGIDVWTDRQYVYGPDYVDEFLWQVPTAAMPVAYMVQDGNYNVMCLVDGTGTVLTQQSFEPYGTVATYEKFENHAVNRVGHQGLFFERFDGTYTEPTIRTDSRGSSAWYFGQTMTRLPPSLRRRMKTWASRNRT